MSFDISTMYNFATNNKWIASIPFGKIEPGLKSENVTFNLLDFTIPEIAITPNTINLYGMPYQIPSNVVDMPMEITFNYLLSSNWYQYILLYKWFYKILNRQQGQGNVDIWDPNKDIIANTTISVFVLSEFLKPIIEFKFDGAWLVRFGALSMDYTGDAAVVKHSFTCTYMNWGVYDPNTGDELSEVVLAPASTLNEVS